jgi:hypothetical protein
MRGKAVAGPGLVAEPIEYSRDLTIRQLPRQLTYDFDDFAVGRATVLAGAVLGDLEGGMFAAFPVNDQVDRRLDLVDRGDDLFDQQSHQTFTEPMISSRMMPHLVELAGELQQCDVIRKTLRPMLSAQRFQPNPQLANRAQRRVPA